MAATSQQEITSRKVAIQRDDTACQFKIASYHCFSSSFLTVTVRKEYGDEYVASWYRNYGKITLAKPDSGSVIVTQAQLTALNKFAEQVSPVKVHSENCTGTTYFKFTRDGFQKEQQLCDCSPDVCSQLLAIINGSK